jgi:hypothetical protein
MAKWSVACSAGGDGGGRRSPEHLAPLIDVMPSAFWCTAVVGVGVLPNLLSFLFKEPNSVLKGGEQG